MARMAAAAVTREEFDTVKAELQKLTIRVEVLTQDVHELRKDVRDLSEAVADMREEMVTKADAEGLATKDDLAEAVGTLKQTIADGHAAILSAVLNLGPR